jgi:hypothetical protein
VHDEASDKGRLKGRFRQLDIRMTTHLIEVI